MSSLTEETVRELAMAMPDVTERPCYGTPGFYVKQKQLFARILDDRETVVVKIDKDEREVRVSAEPEKFFVTDHYRNYPLMIVRLAAVDQNELRDLLENVEYVKWQPGGDTGPRIA